MPGCTFPWRHAFVGWLLKHRPVSGRPGPPTTGGQEDSRGRWGLRGPEAQFQVEKGCGVVCGLCEALCCECMFRLITGGRRNVMKGSPCVMTVGPGRLGDADTLCALIVRHSLRTHVVLDPMLHAESPRVRPGCGGYRVQGSDAVSSQRASPPRRGGGLLYVGGKRVSFLRVGVLIAIKEGQGRTWVEKPARVQRVMQSGAFVVWGAGPVGPSSLARG